jgi:hypothetical protein
MWKYIKDTMIVINNKVQHLRFKIREEQGNVFFRQTDSLLFLCFQ